MIFFYWNDGHKYEGNISQNKFHEKGTFSLINGYRFEGDWDNNKKLQEIIDINKLKIKQ